MFFFFFPPFKSANTVTKNRIICSARNTKPPHPIAHPDLEVNEDELYMEAELFEINHPPLPPPTVEEILEEAKEEN